MFICSVNKIISFLDHFVKKYINILINMTIICYIGIHDLTHKEYDAV